MLSDFFRHSPVAGRPLRVGVLLDGFTIQRSFLNVLEDIQASDFAVLDCAIVRAAPGPGDGPEQRVLGKVINRLSVPKLRRQLLFDLYSRWDRQRWHGEHMLDEVDCSEVFRPLWKIEVVPVSKGFADYVPEHTLSDIRSRNLDVMLRFGFNILRGGVLTAARYGIWSFHHGDNDMYRGGPALFWELWERNPLSGVILQRLTEQLDAGAVLCKSVFATADTMSLAQNRQGPYTATSHFVIRKLYELHRFGADHVNATSIPDRPFVGKRRLYRTPTNLEMLQWLGRRARRRARGMLDRPKTQQWRVGLRRGGPFVVEAVAEGRPADLRGFTWLRNKSGSSYADPFLLRAENTTWLFVEEFVESTKRGRICVADLASHPESPSFAPCLEGPHHLSFPLVFEHDGEFYMIPESADAHEVALYRAERFPFRWVRHKMLLKGDFVDTVVWRDSQWWLLTTVREPVGYSVHALLFSAPALDAEWTRHPAGPLFNDVRTGRNAGAVVVSGGRRYRLSQDDSIVYGRAFQFNEMTRLDCERYEERPSARVEPFLPNMIGTHTYSRAGEWEAIDGCFLERR